ncbi:beta propeller repeat protein [Parachitinimonas caeni]|uniref:Exo-alpha-sialidase n=1 Tax=Parachitinimonas caeni TaxID=3031301 RepID=A0ABT7DZ15_9NEIS|nr:hypothetical protein [Parachitinimonas caeni]MDK2124390.1 hypothetical protein [Parachitinimonas caeni]
MKRGDVIACAAVYFSFYIAWGVYSYPYKNEKIELTQRIMVDYFGSRCWGNDLMDSYVDAKGGLVAKADSGLYRWDAKKSKWKIFFKFDLSERAGDYFPLKNGESVVFHGKEISRINVKDRIYHSSIYDKYQPFFLDENGSAYKSNYKKVRWSDDWDTWMDVQWDENSEKRIEKMMFKDNKIYTLGPDGKVSVVDKKSRSYTLLDNLGSLDIDREGVYIGNHLYLTAHRGDWDERPEDLSRWVIVKIGLDGKYSSILNFGMKDKPPRYMVLKGLVGDDIFFEADRRLYLSRDGGKSAVRIGKNLELNKEKKEKHLDIWGIAKGPDGTLYATRSDAVYKSTDYGMNWTSMGREGIPAEVCS